MQKKSLLISVAVVLLVFITTLVVSNRDEKTTEVFGQTSPQPMGQTSGWTMVFNDEFDGASLDTGKWLTCYPYGTSAGCDHGNGELQWYQPANVSVSNGMLLLTGKSESSNGHSYTSGMVATSGKFSQTYGYMEMKAKLPTGKGYWPAFWLIPEDDSWPPEIDVMEVLGHQPSTLYMTYHWTDGSHQQDESNVSESDLSADFHTYGVDWNQDSIVWYLDGVEKKRFTNAGAITNKPMYIIANLAIGGDWPGNPDGSTAFPQAMEIDYIRAWEKGGSGGTTTPPSVTPTFYCEGACVTGAPSPTSAAVTVTESPTATEETPTEAPIATITTEPCESTVSITRHRWGHRRHHPQGNFMQFLLQLIMQLLERLGIDLPGGGLPTPTPSPVPTEEPLPTDQPIDQSPTPVSPC